MKKVIIALLMMSCCACQPADQGPGKYGVAYRGALKNIMRAGDLSAQAALTDFQDVDHLYALGALENLKGEIQIFDGRPYHSLVQDGDLAFDTTFTQHATLLVYATVPEWTTVAIPADVLTYEQLDNYVATAAAENGMDTDEPFPFQVMGTPAAFTWHVIDWPEGDTEHTHEKHVTSGLHGTEHGRAVRMLGFYSNAHHAIFTHHTTNMHVHVKTEDGQLAGHVDDLTLGVGMKLLLPVVEKIVE